MEKPKAETNNAHDMDGWAERQITLLGVPPDDPRFPELLKVSKRGWRAYQIALSMGMPTAEVDRLRNV